MEKEEEIKAEVLVSNKNDNKENIATDLKINEDRKDELSNEKEKTEEGPKEVSYDFKPINTNKKNSNFVVLSIIVAIILILGILASTIFALLNSNNNKILGGIYVKDILVEGLTKEEAVKMLNEEFEGEKKEEIVLKINGETYSITPEQIEIEYHIEEAVEEAYGIGRNGNIFQNNFEIINAMFEENKIDVEITYNEQLLIEVLEGFNAKIPNSMADNTYFIENNELIITRGIDGLVINTEIAKQQVVECIKNGADKEIIIETMYQKCPEIDIEKIYSEVKAEPQNASYTTEPFEIIPHKNGIDFDIEDAKQLISEEKEEYVIKLNIIEPEILTNEIGEEAFPDLLSSFSTKYDESNVPRSKNLKLASAKLNGVVVMPGEVFSYNKTLGKRTAEAGYEYANGFAGGKVVPMLAGGICQISSTLYDAVLYANLNIVERYNHAFQATYVEPGKDATVVYGALDFKFENTRKYPIMLKASASNGVATVRVFGIKEETEYQVDIVTEVLSYTPYNVEYQDDSSLAPGQQKVSQWGLQGCKSITYRILKLNGQEVKREVLSTDTYDPLSKIIKVGPTVTETPAVDANTTPEPEPTTPEAPTQEPEVSAPETPSSDVNNPTQEEPVVEQNKPTPEPQKPVIEEPSKEPEQPETPTTSDYEPEIPEEPEQTE